MCDRKRKAGEWMWTVDLVHAESLAGVRKQPSIPGEAAARVKYDVGAHRSQGPGI